MLKALRLTSAVFLSLAMVTTVGVWSQTPATPAPTFRAEVEYVEVDVLVTDDQGRFVGNLRKEDFNVFEDGKPQTITNFALVEIPVEGLGKPADTVSLVEPDVQSNERGFTGRIYVLVLDDLHTAPLRAPLVKAAARRFIERHLGSNDLMAIVSTAGRSYSAQDFSSNKQLLSAAVDRFMGAKLGSATLTRNTDSYQGQATAAGGAGDPFEMERGFNARSTARSLGRVAEWLGGIGGRRKTILFISEGIDYDISDVFNNPSASAILAEVRDTVAAATRSNVSIYAIDPRGLSALADEAIEVGQFADQRAKSANDADTSSGDAQRRPAIGMGGFRTEAQLARDSLRTFAEETDGFAAVNTADFATAFDRIVKDNSAYYVLAYYPPSRRDGKFHRIQVRTSRPGLNVRARRGYMARKGNPPASKSTIDATSPALNAALNSPIPVNGVGMRVFAAPFKGTGSNASIVLGIELKGRDLALTQNSRVELSYAVVDASGQVKKTDKDAFTLSLPAETRNRVLQSGIRLLHRFDLAPGRYQIRVASRDEAKGAVGSVSYDLLVPDYSALPFSMSGVLLSSSTGAQTMTARGDAELQRLLPEPPVSLRTFPKGDELIAFAEVYDRSTVPPHTVNVSTTVTSAAGTVAFEHSDQRSSSEMQAARGGYGHMVRVPTATLAPGGYVLTVEAQSRLGDSVKRQVPFEVME